MQTDEKTQTPTTSFNWTFSPPPNPGISTDRRTPIVLAVGCALGLLLFLAFAGGKSATNKQIATLQQQLQVEKERAQELNNDLYDARLQLNENAGDRAQLQTIRELICR